MRTSEDTESKTVTFHSKSEKLRLDVTIDHGQGDSQVSPSVLFKKARRGNMLSEGVTAKITLTAGQAVSFVLRKDIPNHITEIITTPILDLHQNYTQTFWYKWLSQSKFKGAWREIVSRSLMILKMLTYEPTGAIVAAPTFSIPEDIGGVRCGSIFSLP